jgi:hypothetical protein
MNHDGDRNQAFESAQIIDVPHAQRCVMRPGRRRDQRGYNAST